MKRPREKSVDALESHQKFQDLEFIKGPDRFESFFSPDLKKNKRKTHRIDPFPEVVLWDHPDLYEVNLHKKLSTSTPTPFLSLLSNYLDCLVLCSNPSDPSVSDTYLHIFNHIHKYKSLIKQNSASEAAIKDQGFTSSIALIIIPTQGHAKAFIESLVKIHCKGDWNKINKFSRNKYKEIFEDQADTNDAIKLGIAIREKEVNLFSSFKKSDIILGTPLSLKQCLAKDEENNDTGIFCSIQLVAIIDAHLLLMQNWDHLEDIFKNMNLIPDRDSVTVDLNRIREEYIQGNSKIFRQLILHTQIVTPFIMSLFNRNPNIRGKSKTVEHYPSKTLPVVQKFRKFNANDIKTVNDKRFEYFSAFWLRTKEEILPKSVIFVQNYFEYVRIKSFLEENDPGIVCISEYTSKANRQRSISLWNSNASKAICITERLMYFRKLNLKQIGNLYFYSLPDFKEFYHQLVSCCQESLAIFSRYDGFALQRIIGDLKADKILTSNSEIFSIS